MNEPKDYYQQPQDNGGWNDLYRQVAGAVFVGLIGAIGTGSLWLGVSVLDLDDSVNDLATLTGKIEKKVDRNEDRIQKLQLEMAVNSQADRNAHGKK